MEREPISHEEHLKIMVEKYKQEIASCQACECTSCRRSIPLWEEKLFEAMDELERLNWVREND